MLASARPAASLPLPATSLPPANPAPAPAPAKAKVPARDVPVCPPFESP